MKKILLIFCFLLVSYGISFSATHIADGSSAPEDALVLRFDLPSMERYEFGFTTSNSDIIIHPANINIIPTLVDDNYTGTAHTYVYWDMFGGSKKTISLAVSGPLTAPSGNTIDWICSVEFEDGTVEIYSKEDDALGHKSKEKIGDFLPPYSSGGDFFERYSSKENLLVMVEVVPTAGTELTAELYSSSIILEVVDYGG